MAGRAGGGVQQPAELLLEEVAQARHRLPRRRVVVRRDDGAQDSGETSPAQQVLGPDQPDARRVRRQGSREVVRVVDGNPQRDSPLLLLKEAPDLGPQRVGARLQLDHSDARVDVPGRKVDRDVRAVGHEGVPAVQPRGVYAVVRQRHIAEPSITCQQGEVVEPGTLGRRGGRRSARPRAHQCGMPRPGRRRR